MVVRLYERNRRKTLGYDNAFAALSLGGLVLFTMGIFLHLAGPGKSNSGPLFSVFTCYNGGKNFFIAHLSRTSRIAFYYIIAQGFYVTIWSVNGSCLSAANLLLIFGEPDQFVRSSVNKPARLSILAMVIGDGHPTVISML